MATLWRCVKQFINVLGVTAGPLMIGRRSPKRFHILLHSIWSVKVGSLVSHCIITGHPQEGGEDWGVMMIGGWGGSWGLRGKLCIWMIDVIDDAQMMGDISGSGFSGSGFSGSGFSGLGFDKTFFSTIFYLKKNFNKKYFFNIFFREFFFDLFFGGLGWAC